MGAKFKMEGKTSFSSKIYKIYFFVSLIVFSLLTNIRDSMEIKITKIQNGGFIQNYRNSVLSVEVTTIQVNFLLLIYS
jgi:hypothetical protein